MHFRRFTRFDQVRQASYLNVEDDVVVARALEAPAPEYPEKARRRDIQGAFALAIAIHDKGEFIR